MNDKYFIDSNIFIYAKVEGDVKHAKAKELLATFCEGQTIISTQVINEFYNALTKYKVSDELIQTNIINIVKASFLSIITYSTIQSAWAVKSTYKYSFYDSLIIASALENNCTILYSEDLHHGQIIKNSLRIVNPFID